MQKRSKAGGIRDYGRFNGPVRARWLSDGRYMALCNALEFTQSDGRLWSAPVGTRTDGASIPPIFWPFIGGPFEGKYRDASVIHDYECCVKTHAWRDAARMFFDGMMANGEDLWRAKLMYFAVYFFGPHWPARERRPDGKFTERDAARIATLLHRRPAITFDELENLTHATLRAIVTAIPRSIAVAADLSDSKKIRPVDRNGPCIEPGSC
jgi:hypothetical protein